MYSKLKYFLLCFMIMFCYCITKAQTVLEPLKVIGTPTRGGFPLISNGTVSSLYIDAAEAKVVSLASEAFSKDIEMVSGKKAPVIRDNTVPQRFPVIIGTIGKSLLVDSLILSGKLDVSKVRGKWETFIISVIDNPYDNNGKALVIAGSDQRGTAFGIFEVSDMIGVSPLYWWSDVIPEKKSIISITPGKSIVGPPSVKYRGIFINDEKWGLTPWAGKNLDAAKGNMGPNTYARMFELLLRLKANYLWPAMVPGTKAFYYYPENPKMADDYSIVIGSAHCEQMLRNNIYEWAVGFQEEYKVKPGAWRYDLNKEQIYKYWDDRVKQSAGYESTYMIGMRGVGDSEMPGPASTTEKISLWNTIVKDQRGMLEKHLGRPASDIPQTFCPYNEVLDWYRTGKLNLPDDVTMVWVDDNHGYVRQVPTSKEKIRGGGHGMYYHLSYLGQPESYIWLSSISPTLISYELSKSFRYGISDLWVINVGDLKPADMEIQFAMELAWDIDKWSPEKAHTYSRYWAAKTFGEKTADAIAGIKKTYYELAAAGKPEHMGSLTFSVREADERITQYKQLAQKAAAVRRMIPERLRDAYFELIEYQVTGAGLMNQKQLYASRSMDLGRTGDQSAIKYSKLAMAAHDSILRLSDTYHTKVAGGKWNGIMGIVTGEVKARFFNYGSPLVATDSFIRAAQVNANTGVAKTPAPLRIKAGLYSAKKETPGRAIEQFKEIGVGGDGFGIMPFTAASIKGNTVENAPYLEYRVNLSRGVYRFNTLFVPTHAINEEHGLRYAISVNGSRPVYVNLEGQGEHWSQAWGNNVRKGYMKGETDHEIMNDGLSTVRIYLLNPGMILSGIDVF